MIPVFFLAFYFYLSSGQPPVGLNAGAQYDTTQVPYVVKTGAKWVRLNFIVTSSQSGTSDPAFIAMYDGIINAYLANNIKIYGLIGAQSVKQGYDRNNPQAFIGPWTTACNDIVPRWQNNVTVFELFNEPNDWAGGSSAQMTPNVFAQVLQACYQGKHYGGWTAKLISGPLFSFDGTDASDYLYNTYVQGCTTLAWDWFYQHAGTYPLDGIGYHIYTTQGSTDPNTVEQGIIKNLNGIWNNGVVPGESYRFSNPNPNKQLWISEYGWGSANVGEQGQATNLNSALTVFSSASHVALTMWFTLSDFGNQLWGLLHSDYTPKPSFFTFKSWSSGGT